MMLVPVCVAMSPIHGVGMFTVFDVPKGTKLWQFMPGFDRLFTPEEFAALPELAKVFVERHGFLADSGLWVISGDEDQFVNHASDPNMVETGKAWPTADLIASRNITAGEELTQNYLEWDTLIAVKHLPAKD